MNIGQYALGFVGTIISWVLMKRIGRRALYFWGLCILFGFLMVIGGLGVISQQNQSAAWALGTLLMVSTYLPDSAEKDRYALCASTRGTANGHVSDLLQIYTLFYNFTVGPVCYALVAEMPSTRLKIKTVVLARNLYNLVCCSGCKI